MPDNLDIGRRPSAELELARYQALRAEIAAHTNQIWILERYAVVGTAAGWAWMITHYCATPVFAWYLPPLLVAGIAIRILGLYKAIGFASSYIKCREQNWMEQDPHGGWEAFRSHPKRSAGLAKSTTLLGIGFVLVAVLVAAMSRLLLATPCPQ